MMLDSHALELPLPVVWSPPGPFNVEIDDLGMGFDCVALEADLLTAARKASRLLRGWQVRGDSSRVQLHGPDGAW